MECQRQHNIYIKPKLVELSSPLSIKFLIIHLSRPTIWAFRPDVNGVQKIWEESDVSYKYHTIHGHGRDWHSIRSLRLRHTGVDMICETRAQRSRWGCGSRQVVMTIINKYSEQWTQRYTTDCSYNIYTAFFHCPCWHSYKPVLLCEQGVHRFLDSYYDTYHVSFVTMVLVLSNHLSMRLFWYRWHLSTRLCKWNKARLTEINILKTFNCFMWS